MVSERQSFLLVAVAVLAFAAAAGDANAQCPQMSNCNTVLDSCASRPPNGAPEPGEVVDMDLCVENLTPSDATNVIATVTSTTPCITIVPGFERIDFGTILAFAFECDGNIKYEVGCCAPLGSDIDFAIVLESSSCATVNTMCPSPKRIPALGAPCDPPCGVVVDCDLMTGPTITFPPVTPPRAGNWVYTQMCSASDMRLDVVHTVQAMPDTDIDTVGAEPGGTLQLYQIDCMCTTEIGLTKSSGQLHLSFL